MAKMLLADTIAPLIPPITLGQALPPIPATAPTGLVQLVTAASTSLFVKSRKDAFPVPHTAGFGVIPSRPNAINITPPYFAQMDYSPLDVLSVNSRVVSCRKPFGQKVAKKPIKVSFLLHIPSIPATPTYIVPPTPTALSPIHSSFFVDIRK